MPFFNNASSIETSIRSLLKQSYDNFELLLCDNDCDDDSLTIAKSFQDPRVVCLHDGRRLGLATRLNQCIDGARGFYLARMDAADFAYPHRLAQQITFLFDNQDVDVCGGGALVLGDHTRGPWVYKPPLVHEEIVQSPTRGFPLLHSAWMGQIAWFRRWRYKQYVRDAPDQELLRRSYLDSRFANLPELVIGHQARKRSKRSTPRKIIESIQFQFFSRVTRDSRGAGW